MVLTRCDCQRCGKERWRQPERVTKFCQTCSVVVYNELRSDRRTLEETKARRKRTCAAWYQKNRAKADINAKNYHRRLKQIVVYGYGGKCAICGIDDIDVLTIDHVNDNGAQQRKERGRSREMGHGLLTRLRNECFPSEYQVLCANCNMRKENMRRRKNAK